METTSYDIFYQNSLTFHQTKPSGAESELHDVNSQGGFSDFHSHCM